MKYLVTGAAGFIGSHLVEALIARGDEVVALDSFTDYYEAARKEENSRAFAVERLDLITAALDPLVREMDGVFHLASQPGVRSFGPTFVDYLTRNPLATQRLFEAAAVAGVKVVYASSSSIYGDVEIYPTPETAQPKPNSPYGVTKLACELLAATYARSFGLEAVGLRYFTVYGPRQRPDMAFTRILEALANGGSFELYGDGKQSRSFTFVADAVEATILAMNTPAGVIFNVGGSEEATLLEAIALCEQVSGRSLNLHRLAGTAGETRRTAADTSRIEARLGWSARVPLEEGLSAQWRWAASRVSG